MKTCIYGAGAIGAFVGAWLQESGQQVLFIGRQRLLDEINANGGHLIARNIDGKEIRVKPNYATDPEGLKDFDPDLVLIALKSDATRGACEEIKRVLANGTKVVTVVSLQNGATNPVTMREVLPAETFTVLGGMVGFNVAIQAEGQYVQGTQGDLTIEGIIGDTRGVTAAQVSEIFGKAGIRCHVDPSDEFKKVVYGKLCTNLGNAVNALSGIPVLAMLQTRSLRKVIAQL
jgi:2-dehydropantoate 2-reductase